VGVDASRASKSQATVQHYSGASPPYFSVHFLRASREDRCVGIAAAIYLRTNRPDVNSWVEICARSVELGEGRSRTRKRVRSGPHVRGRAARPRRPTSTDASAARMPCLGVSVAPAKEDEHHGNDAGQDRKDED
jgi:hypothetical protein